MGDEFRTLPVDEHMLLMAEGGARSSAHLSFEDRWFAADARPEPTLTASVPVPQEFSGLFRVGLCLDCGKDLPAIARGRQPIADPRVKAQIEEALERRVLEVGIVY